MVWRKQRFLRLAMVGLASVAALSAGTIDARAVLETPAPTPSPTPSPTPACVASNSSSSNTWLTSVAFIPTDPTLGQLSIAPAFSPTRVGPYAIDIPAQGTAAYVKATSGHPTLVSIRVSYQGVQDQLQSGNQSANSYLLSDGNALVLSVNDGSQCTIYTFSVQLVLATPTPSATPTPTPTDTPTPTPIQTATPPLVTGVTPNVIQSETSPVTLTISGLNFDQTAVVNWNGHALETADMTASSLSATVPASFLTDIALPFVAKVTVLNPSTQILSQVYEVAVVDPKTTGQSVVYTGANATAAISTLSASYSGTDPAGIFVASYIKNPTSNSTLQSNSFWDIRFNPTGSSSGSLTCVFTASGSPTGQQLYFFNNGSWQAVQNANLQINSGENTLTVVFNQSSYPNLSNLAGTVFSIAAAHGSGSGGGFPWLVLLLVLVIAVAGGGTYYWWWRNHQHPANEVTLQFK